MTTARFSSQKAGSKAATADEVARDLAEATSNPDHRVVVEWVSPVVLKTDPEIQRDEQVREVNKIVNKFNPNALGTLVLSARYNTHGERELFIIDGLQRVTVVKKLGRTQDMRALVHYGLTVEEEAELFLTYNFRQAVNAWDQFKARRRAHEHQALDIWSMLKNLGIMTGSSRGFQAIGTADKIYAQKDGPTRLFWALKMVRDIYDPAGEAGCYDGRLIEAFSMIYAHFGGGLVNERSLQEKLRSYSNDWRSLIGAGQTNKQVNGGHIATGIANAIINIYNKSKRTDSKRSTRLPNIGIGRRTLKKGSEVAALADVDTDE
jgi:hypothetical protein